MDKSDSATNESDIFAVRLAKLATLCANGKNPFLSNCEQKYTSREAISLFNPANEEQSAVSVAGRIVAFRLMGKAAFLKLLDRDGQIQIYVTKNAIGDQGYAEFVKFDIGDIVGVSGELFKTSTGEITVRANSIVLVSKSLRPLPDKWHGLADSDQIYRQRYLDLAVNGDSRRRAKMRCQIVKEIRKFLWDRSFEEVDCPILQMIAGGAAARPFTTHINALDQDCYLRISHELFLKRMLIAGFDRVFELGRVFRNEGLSRKHSPEFTMIEIYQAYSDYRGMMLLIYDLLQHLCQCVLGTNVVKRFDGTDINLGGEWKVETYSDLVIKLTGNENWFSADKGEKLAFCRKFGLETDPNLEDFEVTQDIYSKLIEPNLIQPTFVTQLPRELCPLAKINANDQRYLDVFELCINGQEIAPAYSEQNDPIIQREMFEAQIGEERQNLDNDFLLAMEYGMPPAGGIGIGVDRLVALLTGAPSIRDTILFPMMRRQQGE
ncbi:MAG: lysine--tRNA ligase [Puniceicoccales bacterium]|jgi:lysyl-tRNA synthetase class 2|nr:lysine--tRNA ligase [Puniceicoccales bacterium]